MERNFRLIRELNTNDVEIYKLQEYQSDNTLCYFMLLDKHRKTTLEDFPYLKGVVSEEEITRDNFIKSFVVSTKEPDDELYEQIDGIIEELTFHLIAPSLEWNNSLKIVSSKEFNKIEEDRSYMLNFFDTILQDEGCSYTISHIKEENYNNLTQQATERK